MLLGRLFAAIPLRDVAWRLNLLSVVCATATVYLVYCLARHALSDAAPSADGVRDDSGARLAAGVAALCFAVSPAFWSQALITEVYTLNAFFVAALLLGAVRGWAGRPWYWLLVGLGLGNHLTVLLLLPSLWMLARASGAPPPQQTTSGADGELADGRHRASRPVALAGVRRALAFTLGLSVYLYLPLRAATQPAINWGDPQTWDGFLWVALAAPYRAYAFALPPAELPARLAAWATLLAQQFGWPGVALALLGLSDMAALRRPLAWATSSVVVLFSIYAVLYRTADSFLYMIPAYMAAALWLGRGGQLVIAAVGERMRLIGRSVIVVALLALPVYQVVTNWTHIDVSHDRAALDFVQAALTDLPPQALLITASDEHTFALWYALAASGRDDVLVVDRDLTQFAWYRRQIERKTPGGAWQDGADDVASYTAELARRAFGQRPVYLAGRDVELPGSLDWREEGVLLRLSSAP